MNTILLIVFSHLFSPLNLQALYRLFLGRFFVQVSPQFYMVLEPIGF
jgi:hypothetical protein